jgi:hypothetical protein
LDSTDKYTNFNIKNNLNKTYIKEVYIDEQRILFNENFDNLENFSKDKNVVQFLVIQVKL